MAGSSGENAMRTRNGKSMPISQRHLRGEQIKDEVYRRMFLLEEKRPDAETQLALALLCAWQITGSSAASDELRDWLKKISPICIELIEATLQSGGTIHFPQQ